MFRLLRKGYIAGLALENAPNAAIIVTDPKIKRSVAIQVKMRLKRQPMKDSHESAMWHDLQKIR